MKFIAVLLFVLSTTATALPAPNFALNNDALPAQLSDLKGSVIYLDFWASWCKPCRKSFPWMNQMQRKYADRNFTVLAVNLDAQQDLAQQFLAKIPADMPIAFDPKGDVAKQYKLLGMPSSYLIDREGNIRFSHKGFFSKKEASYEHEILTLIKEAE